MNNKFRLNFPVLFFFTLIFFFVGSSKAFAQPANDNVCGAVTLTINTTTCYSATNVSATATSGIPAPGCANYQGSDVWFMVVVPAGGHLVFDAQSGTLTDAGMAIYSGATCSGPFTLLDCDDDGGMGNTLMPRINKNGLTVGSTIWIRVWGYGTQTGTFSICVYNAVTPTSGDCMSSTSVCSNFYNPVYSPSGPGNYLEAPSGRTYYSLGCGTYEKNSAWYSFTVETSGIFTFTLNSTDDYDWALYDLTNSSCWDILDGTTLPVRCNWSAATGNTGLNTTATHENETAYLPDNVTPTPTFCSAITCTAGQSFVLLVDNYSAGGYNYTLSFNPSGSGGTAGIYDATGPALGSVTPPSCGNTTLSFSFSEDIACSSVSISDLQLTGPGGPYTLSNLQGLQCNAGATNGKDFEMTVSPALTTSGNFTLSMIGSIVDKCNNPTNTSVTLPFTITNVTASATVTQNVTCFGGTNGAATVTASGGSTPYSYHWSNGQTTQAASNLSSGSQTVTVSDLYGCSAQATVTVTEPLELNPGTIATSQSICYNTIPVTLTSASPASGGSGTIVYQWQYTTDPACATGWVDISGANGATYAPAALTQTTCYRRKSTDNCASSYVKYTPSITITVNPLPVIVSAVSTDVTVCNGSDGTISINATGTGLTYSINGISGTFIPNSGAFSSLPQGLYPVAVQNSAGCIASGPSLTINAALAPAAPTAGSNATYCSGQPLTDIWATAISGATLTWYSDPGLTSNIGGGATYSPSNTIGTTNYYVTQTKNACESAPAVVSITINPIPTVTATPASQTICSCTSTSIDIITPIPGTTLSWSFAQSGVTGASTPTNSIYQSLCCSGPNQGVATYTVTPSANGCVGTPLNIQVFVNPNPTVVATPSSQTICSEDTTQILLSSPVAGATFTWYIVQNSVTGGSNGSGDTIAQILTNGITGQGTATYTVTATASLCSGATHDVVVTVNPMPDVTANPSAPFICSNSNPAIALTSTVPSASFNWTVVQNNVTGASAGGGSIISQTLNNGTNADGTAIYTITPSIFTCNGNPINVTVTVHPIATTIATPASETVCTYGITNIALTSNVPGATFSWTVPASANIIGASNGNGYAIAQTLYNNDSIAHTINYSVTAEISGCLGLPLSVPITVNPFPLVTATPLKDTICSNTNTNFALTSNVAGASFNWTVSTSPNISGGSNSSGTTINQTLINSDSLNIDSLIYTIIASANTCTGDTISIPIYVNPQPIIDFVDTTYTSCGGTDGSITIIAFGTPPLEYSIDGGNTFSSNGGVFTNLGNSNHTVAVRDANGCITIGDTVSIMALNAPPAPLAERDTSYCLGEAMIDLIATPSASGTLTWYSDPGLTTVLGTGPTFTPLNTVGTTRYYVTEGAGSCESPSNTVTIIIKALPTFVATPPTQTFCSGGTTSISLTSVPSGGTFTWTVTQNNVTGATNGIGAFINQTLTAGNSSSGTAVYAITAHANGCNGDSANVTVYVNPLPQLLLNISSNVCQNVSSINLGLSATPPGGTFSGTGISGNTFIPNVAGLGQHIITYTYTDNNTCTNTTTDTITVNQLPTVSLAPFAPVCAQSDTFSLVGGSPSGGIYYGNGITSGVFYPDSAGLGSHTITYSYTDSAGCENTATNALNVVALPVVSILSSTPVSCHNLSNASAMASSLGGTQPYSYHWSNGQNNATAIGLYSDTLYFVTVTDFNGCKDFDSISFINPLPLTITEAHANPTCGISNGFIAVIPSGGTSPYSYQWSNSESTDTISNLAAGVYHVTVYDAHNCFIDTIISLTTNPSVAANLIVTNPTCFGYTNGSIMAMITGGTGPFTYLWSNGVTTALNNNLPADTFVLIISDIHGCNYVDTVILTEPQQLTLSLQTTNVSCFGYNNGDILTSVDGGTQPVSYQWSTSLPSNALTAGNYSVTVTDANNCSAFATDTVTQPSAALTATVTTTHINCFGDSTGTATVLPTGGSPLYTYIWNTNPFQTSDQAINLKAGLYRVTVIDYNLCQYIDTIRVNQSSQMELKYEVLNVSCEDPEARDGEIRMHASGGNPLPTGYKYFVSSNPEQYDSIAENLYKGSYDIRIQDSSCFKMFKIEVPNTVGPCLIIPTVFTPNADGTHDTWNIKNIRFYPKATIEIYNRWGSLIFNKAANEEQWDGKYNGVDVPSGTYIYILDLKNNTKPKEGTISIIR